MNLSIRMLKALKLWISPIYKNPTVIVDSVNDIFSLRGEGVQYRTLLALQRRGLLSVDRSDSVRFRLTDSGADLLEELFGVQVYGKWPFEKTSKKDEEL